MQLTFVWKVHNVQTFFSFDLGFKHDPEVLQALFRSFLFIVITHFVLCALIFFVRGGDIPALEE